MKVTITEEQIESKERKFPVLMKSVKTGLVVLFHNPTSGIVIIAAERIAGYYSTAWQECNDGNYWQPFTGTITLSND
jgi:hypothetical protein